MIHYFAGVRSGPVFVAINTRMSHGVEATTKTFYDTPNATHFLWGGWGGFVEI